MHSLHKQSGNAREQDLGKHTQSPTSYVKKHAETPNSAQMCSGHGERQDGQHLQHFAITPPTAAAAARVAFPQYVPQLSPAHTYTTHSHHFSESRGFIIGQNNGHRQKRTADALQAAPAAQQGRLLHSGHPLQVRDSAQLSILPQGAHVQAQHQWQLQGSLAQLGQQTANCATSADWKHQSTAGLQAATKQLQAQQWRTAGVVDTDKSAQQHPPAAPTGTTAASSLATRSASAPPPETASRGSRRVLLRRTDSKKPAFTVTPHWTQMCALVSTSFQATLPDRVAPASNDVGELMAVYDTQQRHAFFGVDVRIMDIWVDVLGVCELVLPSTGAHVRTATPAVPSAGQGGESGGGSFVSYLNASMVKHRRVAFAPSAAVLAWVHAAAAGTPGPGDAIGAAAASGAVVGELGGVQPAAQQYCSTAHAAALLVDDLIRAWQSVERFRVVNYRARGSREIQYAPVAQGLHALLLEERLVQHAVSSQ